MNQSSNPCECGCGQDAGYFTYTNTNGVKGEPRRFVNGHNSRGQPSAVTNESKRQRLVDDYEHFRLRLGLSWGECFCGCCENTEISQATDTAAGRVKGLPRLYVHGHHRRKFGPPYVEEDRGYSSPCWIWQRFIDGGGYGMTNVRGYPEGAHRYYYEQAYGPIAINHELHHLCTAFGGPKSCVNPEHLEPLTCKAHRNKEKRYQLPESRLAPVRELLATTHLSQQCIADLCDVSKATVSQISRGLR